MDKAHDMTMKARHPIFHTFCTLSGNFCRNLLYTIGGSCCSALGQCALRECPVTGVSYVLRMTMNENLFLLPIKPEASLEYTNNINYISGSCHLLLYEEKLKMYSHNDKIFRGLERDGKSYREEGVGPLKGSALDGDLFG